VKRISHKRIKNNIFCCFFIAFYCLFVKKMSEEKSPRIEFDYFSRNRRDYCLFAPKYSYFFRLRRLLERMQTAINNSFFPFLSISHNFFLFSMQKGSEKEMTRKIFLNEASLTRAPINVKLFRLHMYVMFAWNVSSNRLSHDHF
jgi:hypothetical protein